MAAMARKLRLVSALCALATAGVVVTQTNPVTPTGGDAVQEVGTATDVLPKISTLILLVDSPIGGGGR